MDENDGIIIEEITSAVLQEGEQAIVDRIGRKHTDYCTIAILKERRPDMVIEYDERHSIVTADGIEISVRFDLDGFEEALSDHPEMDMIALMVDGLENTIMLAKDYTE